MKKGRIILIIIAVIVIIAIYFISSFYSKYQSFLKTETVKIDKDLTVVLGGGGNSGILNTDSAVVVIDTKMKDPAKALYSFAKSIAGSKKIIVINTHYHPDHSDGNKYYKGSKIYAGSYDLDFLKKNMDNDNLPTYLVRDTFELDLGNEKVDLYNMGQAHTFDDLVVYLKNRKILFTGDLVFNHMNPVLKKESGANVDKWIGALKTIVTKWDINQLVPGHGKIDGKELAYSLIQYFNDMKECAANTDKQKELTIKYKDWFTMPFMASTDKTIDYIKNSN